MVEKLEPWELLPNGMIKILPMTGFACTPLSSGDYAIQFRFAESPAQHEAIAKGQQNPSRLQLGASPQTLDLLIDGLTAARERMRNQTSAAGKAN
jgi:hypothetical protein